MQRREFLSMAGLLGLTAGMQPMLAPFARLLDPQDAGAPGDADALDVVSDALVSARRQGKPVLVFVIPARVETQEERAEVWTRGRTLGAWLNHGAESQVVDLALCVVVCASMPELAAHVPGLSTAREPWMVLVETDGAEPGTRFIDGELPPLPESWGLGFGGKSFKEHEAEMVTAVKARTAALHALFRDGLYGNRSLEARARWAGTALTPEELERLGQERLDVRTLPLGLKERGAALLRLRGERGTPNDVDAVNEVLGLVAHARLREQAPAGSYWATSGGCGMHIENDPRESRGAFGCGMGRTPSISRRFLYLFTLQ